MSLFSLTVVGHWGAYPGPGEACSCYLLEAQGTRVLLDCGSGSLSLLQKTLPLQQIDAVVLSHYHADHVADLGSLQYAARIDMDLGRRARPLLVYGHGLDPASAKLGYLDFAEGRVYGAASIVEIGPFSFGFLPTVHPDPCFAIRASCAGRSLVYTGDMGPTPGMEKFAAGTELLLCEASLYDEYRGKVPGHMSAGEAGALARDAGAKTLVITHLPHFGRHADLLAQAQAAFGGETLMAQAGLRLDV